MSKDFFKVLLDTLFSLNIVRVTIGTIIIYTVSSSSVWFGNSPGEITRMMACLKDWRCVLINYRQSAPDLGQAALMAPECKKRTVRPI